jgi:potassium-dependent mechanosensitive channel
MRIKASRPPFRIIHSLPCYMLAALFLASLLTACPRSGQAQSQPGTAVEAPAHLATPKILPKILDDGIASLKDTRKTLQSQLTESRKNLEKTKVGLDNLQVAVASVKAALAVKKPPLFQVQDLLDTYQKLATSVKDTSNTLDQEISTLSQQRDETLRAANTLRVQIDILRAREPAPVVAPLQQPYLEYLQLSSSVAKLQGQVLGTLQQQRQALTTEGQLLAGLVPELKQLEAAWKVQLLKRPAQPFSLLEQAGRIIGELETLPGKVWRWTADLVASGTLGSFLRNHIPPLVGLLVFIILLGWGARRLQRLATRRFRDWRARTLDLDMLPIYRLGQILASNVFLLGVIFWLGLLFWILGVFFTASVQAVLSVLVALWALRLSWQWVRAFFAGKDADGVLPLDRVTARFYRRSLQIFLAYLALGTLCLRIAAPLGFPDASRLFLQHIFLLTILVWVLWLLKPAHLARLLPELHDPVWIHRPWFAISLRSSLALSLGIAVLADLLGFQNLGQYVSQAVSWTLMATLVLWLLWLVAETVVYHLLHPDTGWVKDLFPRRARMLQRFFRFSRGALSLILGAAVVLWSLSFWGIQPSQVAWAFQWLTWGPILGPVKLTTLNVGGTLLVLYLGLWASRLIRGLIELRIFPHTALDTGVRYTISTTVHYVVLVIAVLIALNVLGFPLTNLALVAGALGVGIGFGLQNIVNNFISGLILLFERPIKVGDMLVIDGQWGEVKEIRVRSTIFETYDRYVLIIPNSELVSNKVLNWTHYGRGINRLTLKVGVGYGSDVREVTRLITELCEANPRVVKDPSPQIYFSAYGDSSLDFTIWVHVQNPNDRIPATHELNSAILDTLRQQGIEIPFPHRDVHIMEVPEGLSKKGRQPHAPPPNDKD